MRVLFLSCIACLYGEIAIFNPPPGWEIAQLENQSPYLKIGFLRKGAGEFLPSINLSVEEDVQLSFKEYIEAAKRQHKQEGGIEIRDLGSFPLACGPGRLLDITNPSPFGEIKILQVLFLKESKAYILTSAVLKKDFFQFQKEILDTFHSFNLIDSLFSQIADPQKKNAFLNFFSKLGTGEKKDLEWKSLQRQALEFSELGPYWIFLLLQEGHAKIYYSTALGNEHPQIDRR